MTADRPRENVEPGRPHRPRFDLVAIGASAGGLPALVGLLGALPVPFPAAIALVLHLSPEHPSHLTEILSRSTRRPVAWARDGSELCPGAVYAAPPDRHLVITRGGRIALATSPRVHFARPSVDRLFASAARALGPHVLAVLLTGNGFDGAKGAMAVRRAGGVVIAQDEASSEYFSMPREAIQSGAASAVLPLDAIPGAITELVTTGVLPDVDQPPRRKST